jgi:hypothetical protein
MRFSDGRVSASIASHDHRRERQTREDGGREGFGACCHAAHPQTRRRTVRHLRSLSLSLTDLCFSSSLLLRSEHVPPAYLSNGPSPSVHILLPG